MLLQNVILDNMVHPCRRAAWVDESWQMACLPYHDMFLECSTQSIWIERPPEFANLRTYHSSTPCVVYKENTANYTWHSPIVNGTAMRTPHTVP